MAWVKIRVPRTSQPQDTCGIDRGNPITAGLAVVRTGNELYGSSGGTITAGPIGLQVGGTSVRYPLGEVPTEGITLFQLARFGSVNNISSLNICTGTSDGIGFKNNTTSIRLLNYGGTGNTITISSKTLPINTTVAVCGTYDGATQRIYQDGEQTGSTSKTGALVLGASPTLNLGASFAVGSFTGGTCPLLLYYTRALPAAEVKSLTDNPWQIFEPEEITIWIPDDAGTSGADNLTAKDITLGAVTVSKPSVGQSHVLSGKSLNLLATDVTSPTIYQVHQLSGKSVSTDALTISKPVLVYVPVTVDLVGKNISLGTATISSPVLGQIHELTGSNLNLPGVILTKPVISQVHGLNAQGINLGEVTVTKPELTSASNTDNLTAKSITLEALQVTKPSIEQIHLLTGLDVSLDGLSITNSIIGQVHVLQVQPVTLAQAVISKPELTSLANTDALSPKDITLSALTVSNPAITQVHALLGKSLVTGSVSIVKPLLGQIHGLAPKGVNLGSWNITKPILIIGGTTDVYIDEILSDVVDDKIIVLLQDEVIQVNILSETI